MDSIKIQDNRFPTFFCGPYEGQHDKFQEYKLYILAVPS